MRKRGIIGRRPWNSSLGGVPDWTGGEREHIKLLGTSPKKILIEGAKHQEERTPANNLHQRNRHAYDHDSRRVIQCKKGEVEKRRVEWGLLAGHKSGQKATIGEERPEARGPEQPCIVRVVRPTDQLGAEKGEARKIYPHVGEEDLTNLQMESRLCASQKVL